MKSTLIKAGLIAIAAAVISACGGDDNDSPTITPSPDPTATATPTMTPTPTPVAASVGLGSSVLDESHRFDKPASRALISVSESASVSGALDYSVMITNLTNAQPMSPVLVVMHGSGYSAFTDGATASTALEYMAEGGDISFLVTEAMAAESYVDHESTTGPVGPKSSQTLSFTVGPEIPSDLSVTLLSMLVNTNDGFTGLNAVDISNLSAGDSVRLYGNVWDSGTEANSEAAGTMPGPADGGEGFNAARSDTIDKVRIHAGVVTNALAEGIVSN